MLMDAHYEERNAHFVGCSTTLAGMSWSLGNDC